MKTNCPNCGAPIQGPKCEYCGTNFRDYRTNLDEVNLIKAKTGFFKQQAIMRDLYDDAIRAMRVYAHRY